MIKAEEIAAILESVPELPSDQLVTYVRIWQFETWLRQMAYVELRAKYGDSWNTHFKGKADRARNNDELLTHMPTSEKLDLSFISFGALIETIADEWTLFESFLPPKNIWAAKIDEVSQIRNRVAHFRKGHVDDHQRVIQLIRDADKGFFRFCTSLNESLYFLSNDADPVIHEFAVLNPYIKRDMSDKSYSPYSHYVDRLEIGIEIVKRPWIDRPEDFTQVIGQPGFFYDLNIQTHDRYEFRYEDLLKSTKKIHEHALYILLDSLGVHLRVLIPSLLGKEMLIEIVGSFIDAAVNNMWHGRSGGSLSMDAVESDLDKMQMLADRWPEYVIGPRNPISFLTSEMECSFFGV